MLDVSINFQQNIMIKVVTYNVLSDALFNSNDKTLTNENRFNSLNDKLVDLMCNDIIICLQEMSFDWYNQLNPLFIEFGYHFVYKSYGSKSDGFMGVGIAYPLTHYQLKEQIVQKVTELKEWSSSDDTDIVNAMNRADIHNYTNWECIIKESLVLIPLIIFCNYLFNTTFLYSSLLYFSYMYQFVNVNTDAVYNAYNRCKNKSNVLIGLKLEIVTEKSDESSSYEWPIAEQFWVFTYHMPFEFNEDIIMVTHASLVKSHIEKIAEDQPFILCIDLNASSSDSAYKLLIDGTYDDNVFSTYPINDQYRPTSSDCNWSDCNWTNVKYTVSSELNNGDTLKERIDYIFVNDGMKLIDIYQPSDHFPIYANLCINT